jgi:hypothetical protein
MVVLVTSLPFSPLGEWGFCTLNTHLVSVDGVQKKINVGKARIDSQFGVLR